MIECSKCGSENHFDGAAFCKRCGAELSAKVAVEVIPEPNQLNQTEKIRIKGKSAAVETASSSEEFTVEDVSDPEDKAEELKRLSPSTQEGGIDKLLTLYGNDSPIEQAQSDVEDDAAETKSLGIESASDYLLREQPTVDLGQSTTTPVIDKPTGQHLDKLTEIQAKLTHIDDNEPEIKNPMGSPKSKTVASAVPVDEKHRLLDSLNKSLHNEPLSSLQNSVTQSRKTESTFATVSTDSSRTDNVILQNQQSEAVTMEETVVVPEPIVPTTPVAYIRGNKLTFPNNTRMLPGDRVVHNDREYVVRPGAIDKRSWILGGILAAVLVIIMIVQSLTAPEPMKATLFGVATNSETNEVLAGISVSIPQLNISTVTDEHGVFKFAGVADGRYDVKFEGELYEARFFPIIIQNNQSDILYGTVTPLLPKSSRTSTPTRSVTVASVPSDDQPEYGTLKIQCNVADASVLLDGKTLGKTSQVFKRLKPGTRNIVIQADGYQEIAQVVNVVAGQTTELTANLLSLNDNKPVEYTADDFFEQAEVLFGEQKYIEAVGYYTLALAKNSSMVKSYLRRAEAHLQAGKPLNARADYRSAADLYINSGMYNQAIACYDKIISFQPDASDAFSLRGWAKIAVGDFDNGLSDLQKVLNFSPEDQQAQFDLGKAYYITNRYKDAEKILKKIRKNGDEYPEIYGYLALTELAQGDESDARKAYDSFRKVASSGQIARMSTQSGWQRLTALAGN